MAKKGNRVQVILECTEHKESGMPGTSRYITTKNKSRFEKYHDNFRLVRKKITEVEEKDNIRNFKLLCEKHIKLFNKNWALQKVLARKT